MENSLIQILIICAYIGVLFLISAYVKYRSSGSVENYVLAGRKLTTPLVMVSVVGLAVGGASTIGVAEQAYTKGLSAGWYTAAWGIGAIVMGLTVAKRYRRMNITTVPELLERYYGRNSMIAGIACQILVQLVIMSLQFVAGGAILSALLPDFFTPLTGMLISAVVFIGITLIGGLWSSGLSNIVSVCLIYVGVLYSCFAAVNNAGGIENIAAQLPPTLDWFDPLAGIPMAVIIGWFIVMVTQAITAQGPVQIACGARDAKTARKGLLLGGILIFPIGFLCALLGIVAKVSFPDITATMALPKVVMSLNPVASGTTLAALWAADVSTACTILLGAGTLFSQDIYKRFINPSVSDEKFVTVNRLTIFGVGLITLWFAFNAAGILKTMIAGLSMTTALTCVFLFTVFAPGLCRRSSAFYTTLVGLLGLVVWEFVPALHVLQHVIYFEWLICIVTFLIVAVVDKTPIKVPEYVEEEA